MDTITQAALGAAVGQAGFAKSLGRKANWYGAAAGLVPDLDVICGALAGEWQSLVIHRGPTHALWFGPVVGSVLGWLTWKYYVRRSEKLEGAPVHPPPLRAWIGLWVLGLLTHPLLDVFTTYGTQLLAPFSDQRFSLYGVGIIDPFYTLPLGIALFIGYRSRTRPHRAMWSARIALMLTTLYLCYGVFQNATAQKKGSDQITELGLSVTEVRAYPTLFQPWLRRIVARDAEHVYVTFLNSLNADAGRWIALEHHLDNQRVQALLNTEEGEIFRWFSNEQMVGILPDEVDHPVLIDDFRYGMVTDPTRGIWGMKAKVNMDGTLESPPTRFNHRPKEPKTLLKAFWNTLIGTDAPRETTLHRQSTDRP